MKTLFSQDSDAFVTRRIDKADAERIDTLEKELEAEEFEAPKEPPLTPMQYVLVGCGLVIIAILLYLTSVYHSIGEGFTESPVVTGVFAACCLLAVVITVIDKAKNPRAAKAPDPTVALTEELDTLIENARKELAIPEETESLDVIALTEYDDPDLFTKADTLYLTVFKENETIVLTDYEARYELPITSIVKIETIERKITLTDAVKPTLKSLRHEYDVEATDEGYAIPTYDRVTITHNGEEYALLLPTYDGAVIKALLSNENEDTQ